MSLLTTLLMTCSVAGELQIVGTIETGGANVVDLAYSTDGDAIYCVVGESGSEEGGSLIERFELDSGRLMWRHENERNWTQIAADTNGRRVATCGWEAKPIEIREADTGNILETYETPQFYLDHIRELEFTDNGNAVVGCARGENVLHVDLGTGELQQLKIDFEDIDEFRNTKWRELFVTAWAISKKRGLVAGGTSRNVARFIYLNDSGSVESVGTPKNYFPGYFSVPPVRDIAFSPDGTTLAMASWLSTRRFEVRLWRLNSNLVANERQLSIPCDIQKMLVLKGGNEIVVAMSYRGSRISIWNVETEEQSELFELDDGWVNSMAYCPPRDEIAIGTSLGKIVLVSVASDE